MHLKEHNVEPETQQALTPNDEGVGDLAQQDPVAGEPDSDTAGELAALR